MKPAVTFGRSAATGSAPPRTATTTSQPATTAALAGWPSEQAPMARVDVVGSAVPPADQSRVRALLQGWPAE